MYSKYTTSIANTLYTKRTKSYCFIFLKDEIEKESFFERLRLIGQQNITFFMANAVIVADPELIVVE
jgi:hypothetical protein